MKPTETIKSKLENRSMWKITLSEHEQLFSLMFNGGRSACDNAFERMKTNIGSKRS